MDDLSKWYLRRSRRRFWKSESDADKQAAYATLYETLVTLSKLLAPTMPFLAEELYQNLVRSVDQPGAESVHLADWPEAILRGDRRCPQPGNGAGDAAGLAGACSPQPGCTQGAPAAGRGGLSPWAASEEAHALERYADLLADELNVKQVRACWARRARRFLTP